MRQQGAGYGLAAEDAVGHGQLHRIWGLAAPVGPPQESWASSAAAEVRLGLASRLYG